MHTVYIVHVVNQGPHDQPVAAAEHVAVSIND